jgi:acyl-CoA reductase-like NAD-dependent aldehyde dehydrogenase
VQEGIDTAYYAATEGRRLFGHVVPSELRSKWAMNYRRPIGIVGLITPFNFPMAIPTWKMFPALVCGNAVIIKPSEDVPHTVHLLVDILLEAGLPPEVIQLVHGRGETVGKALVEHPEVPVISFTGSTETGAIIGETCGRMHKRLSLEMGGKNAMIVMDDADLDLALEGVLWGAFGTTGQRCTATSRLILHRKVHDRFLRRVSEAAEGLRLGDGRETRTDVGPLIHEGSREKVEQYVEIGREEGADLVVGGRAPGGRLGEGWFYRPTVFAGVRPRSRLEQEEIFGPVLSVIRADDERHAVELANDSIYGLNASVFTPDVDRARAIASRLRTGTVGQNAFRTDLGMSFGGYKQSGIGREGLHDGLEAYLESKSVILDGTPTDRRDDAG